MNVSHDDLVACGLSAHAADQLLQRIQILADADPGSRWYALSQKVLSPKLPPSVHGLLFQRNFEGWSAAHGPPPYWFPDPSAPSNIGKLVEQLQLSGVSELRRWSYEHRADFWRLMSEQLGIVFRQPCRQVLD